MVKITIESTGRIAKFDGVQCSFWSGVTESGAECVVFVHRIAVSGDGDVAEFDRELRAATAPTSVEIVGMRQDWG
jgi:hypothetical protein